MMLDYNLIKFFEIIYLKYKNNYQHIFYNFKKKTNKNEIQFNNINVIQSF